MAELSVTCCIAGGGPAGIMAGFLLARAGVDVLVLEKHADFLRDFRGDTIHPSTMEVLAELGLLDEFLALPHQRIETLSARVGDTSLQVADFRHLPVRCPFIAIIPQWDFLNFIAGHARRLPGFNLEMRGEATGLIEEEGTIVGLRAQLEGEPIEVRARLVIGADGRHSTVRAAAGLAQKHLGVPMDVVWFRLPHHATDPDETFGRVNQGKMLVLINRREYWQCGLVIPKGGFDRLRAAGLDSVRKSVAELLPFLADRLNQLDDWDKLSLLVVTDDRLERWHRAGLLCIGDAAHAMSPVGGVGINLAIQDAVATANLIAEKLRDGALTEADLAMVQRRREFPTAVTQAIQLAVQNGLIGPVLRSAGVTRPPFAIRALASLPPFRRLVARVIGMGVRPEHVLYRPVASPAP